MALFVLLGALCWVQRVVSGFSYFIPVFVFVLLGPGALSSLLASLRVEGVGAEGLPLQFLGFALLLDPGGRGCLFRAGALLVRSKKVCVGGKPFAWLKQLCLRFWLSCF